MNMHEHTIKINSSVVWLVFGIVSLIKGHMPSVAIIDAKTAADAFEKYRGRT